MDNRRTYAMFAIVTLTAALGALTQTSMNSMLSGVQESFGTPESISQWLTTIYMLVIGVTVPLVTHLARRYSVRTLIFVALAFMLVGAVIAAFSPNFGILLFARVLQAVSAGIMLPVMQTIAMTRFPPGQNATAMGIAGIALGFAPNIGPLFGGLLVDSWGWRSFFWILSGIIVVLALATLAFVRKREHQMHDAHLDYLSALLSTVGFGCVLLSFSTAAYRPVTDPTIWAGLVVGIVCVAWFVLRQRRIKYPLIHMSIFKSHTYVVSFITQNLLNASFMGITLILPLFIVNVAQMTPVDAGLVFLPTTILAAVFNPLAGILSDKIGPRPVIVVSAFLLVAGSGAMAFITADTPFWLITALQVVRGIGVSSIIGPLNSWGMHKLPVENMIDGSAFFTTVRQACASFGTALMMLLISVVGGALGYNLALGLSALFAVGVLVCSVFFVRDLKS